MRRQGTRTLILSIALLLGTLLAAHARPAEEVADRFPRLQPAVGLPDPTLALGLNAVSDWSGVLPFIDVFKTVRPWVGGTPDRWSAMTFVELKASGCLDEQGWPSCLPPGIEVLRGVFAWVGTSPLERREFRRGVYHLFYEGQGDLRLRNVSLRQQQPGHLVFELDAEPGNWWLEIRATGSARGTDHLRNIAIVREGNLELFEAGAVFDPLWLRLVADARQLRFMGWSGTNDGPAGDWNRRPRTEDFTWAGAVPYEIQLDLANHVGADPWLTLPADASDAFVAALAQLVRRRLDTRLVAWVELGNETWNLSFAASRQLVERGRERLASDETGAYYRLRASEVMATWQAQYAVDETHRYRRVLGAQTGNLWLTQRLLAGSVWRDRDPQAWTAAADSFDVLAVSSYFGAPLLATEAGQRRLLEAYRQGDFSAVDESLLEGDTTHSIAFVAKRLAAQRRLANDSGLRLVLYEGGQHVHHWRPGVSDDPEMLQALAAYVRSPSMAALYGALWEVWRGVGEGPFMQFVEAGSIDRYGSWGLRIDPQDNPPRARLLDRLNAATGNWWGDAVSGQYLQGITRRAANGGRVLTGTSEEDYLIGGDGDDHIYPGPGADVVHGGDGEDTLLLGGDCRAYTLLPGTGRYRYELQGPDGPDRLAAVETLRFASGEKIHLRDIAPGGTLCDGQGS